MVNAFDFRQYESKITSYFFYTELHQIFLTLFFICWMTNDAMMDDMMDKAMS